MNVRFVFDRLLQAFKWLLFIFVMANLGAISIWMIATAFMFGKVLPVILISLFSFSLMWSLWRWCVPELVHDWNEGLP